MNIAFVTGGGDSAGINSAISRAILHGMNKYGSRFIGVKKAFEGLASDTIEDYCIELNTNDAGKIFHEPSTILGSSRFAPFSEENVSWAPEKIRGNLEKLNIDAIIATGGNDTVKSALGIHETGIPIIAIPKSIDNDISCTEWMLGANTAIDFAREAFMSTAVSAETHARVSVNEIMGRKAGWLAFLTGIATNADIILVPEKTFQLQELIEKVRFLKKEKGFANIIVSEGININTSDTVYKHSISDKCDDKVLKAMLTEKPEFDEHGNVKLGGAGIIIQRMLSNGLGCPISSIRQTNIGFSLRGLKPNAFDINLGQRFGRKAIDLLHEGMSGLMTGVRGMNIIGVPMKDALPQYTLDAMDPVELKDFGVLFNQQDTSH